MSTFHRKALWEDDDKWQTLSKRTPRIFFVSVPGHAEKRIRAKTKAQALSIYARVRQLSGADMRRATIRPGKETIMMRR